MSEVQVGQYVSLEKLKDALEITDSVDDTELLDIVQEANEDIQIKLKPYAATLPLTDGTQEFKAATKRGLIYSKARWAEKKKNFEKAKRLDTLYENKMDDLKKALKAEPEVHTRNKPKLYTKDPRDSKTILPSQSSVLAFDNF